MNDKIILFEGRSRPDSTSGFFYLNDIWSYDFASNQWTNLAPSSGPSARGNFGMTYDSLHDKILLFGGFNDVSSGLSDMWEYDYITNTWRQLFLSNSQSSRSNFQLIYDDESDKTILFGGLAGIESDET